MARLAHLAKPDLGAALRRPLELFAMFGFCLALAGLAALSLYWYVIPGLG